ncbi:sulfatase family protein [Paraglaciecola sp.]|uniref:sulfatase family protein n=1 Tax=Paraglaciecola sp. TaxID=1920173 RepID=UPI003EF8642B
MFVLRSATNIINLLKKTQNLFVQYYLIFAASILAFTGCQHTQLQSHTPPQKKPNFVWLISEDNSPDYLRLYNKNGAVTPNIEALAKHGLQFNNAYSTTPVCSTARSTLALGMYAPSTGTMHHRAFTKANYDGQLKTIYQLMKEGGYYVTNNAKTDFNFAVKNQALFSEEGKLAHWRNRAQDQAFFHTQTFTITHESRVLFPASDLITVPTQHQVSQMKVKENHPDTPLFRYTQARYLDLHTQLDKQIGTVIKQLKEDKQLESTFVFYFSDHGGVLPGSKGYANESGLKIPLLVRIPKNYRHLVSKTLLNNTQVDGFISFVDLPPTLLKLAGLEQYTAHQGKAFLSKELHLDQINRRNTIFGFADRFGEKSDLVRTIRVGKYKYVRHFTPMNPDGLFQNYRYKSAAFQEWKSLFKAGKLNHNQAAFFKQKPIEALFDLNEDPQELTNLANQDKYKPIIVTLRKKLFTSLKSLPDLGFIPESYQTKSPNNNTLQYASFQQQNIAKYIDITNLTLSPFSEVQKRIEQLLKNGTELEKYWTLMTLTTFGTQAKNQIEQVKGLLKQSSDSTISHHLVKARAIEFLAHLEAVNPTRAIEELIYTADSPLQALEIMNIAAILKDKYTTPFHVQLPPNWLKTPDKSSENYLSQKMLIGSLKARMLYLNDKG